MKKKIGRSEENSKFFYKKNIFDCDHFESNFLHTTLVDPLLV